MLERTDSADARDVEAGRWRSRAMPCVVRTEDAVGGSAEDAAGARSKGEIVAHESLVKSRAADEREMVCVLLSRGPRCRHQRMARRVRYSSVLPEPRGRER